MSQRGMNGDTIHAFLGHRGEGETDVSSVRFDVAFVIILHRVIAQNFDYTSHRLS